MVKLTEKLTGKSYLGKQRSALSLHINWIDKKHPVELSAKVTAISRLSSTPLSGAFFEPWKQKLYFLALFPVWTIVKDPDNH